MDNKSEEEESEDEEEEEKNDGETFKPLSTIFRPKLVVFEIENEKLLFFTRYFEKVLSEMKLF